MADAPKNPDDDKSINDLLKEYAGDVKDRDLDDFLKSADEDEDDDAFETDADEDEETDPEEESEKVLAQAGQERKRGGGLLTMLLIVVAFGAAGAGAYIYLNRDDGMTNIMGGFAGGNDEPMDSTMPPPPPAASENTPPVAEAPAAQAPVAANENTPAMPEAPAQPMPIMNEPAPAAPAADTASSAPISMPAPAAEPAPAPGADLLSVPVTAPEAKAEPEKAPQPAAEPAKAPEPETASAPQSLLPADNKAAQAVTDWNDGLPPANTDANAPLPEKPVAEIKAKAPKTQAAPKAPSMAAAEPKKKSPAAAPKAASEADGALPPPYLAIQAKKNGGAAPIAATASAAPKMAPVVDDGKIASTSHRDVEGNTNKNVADVTKATGDTAAMVANGGGVIEKTIPAPAVPVTTTPSGIPMPVGMMKALPATPAEAPMETIPLAINGGRSLPPGTVETRAYAQIPNINANQQAVPAAPEAPSEASPVPQAEAPAQDVGTVQAVPPAPQAPQETLSGAAPISTGSNDAPALVAQAQAAEKAGQTGDALELYQKALEDDAIYGDGHSIDRGAVYDRIGAIKAGQ